MSKQNLTVFQNGYTVVDRSECMEVRKGQNVLPITDIPLGIKPSSFMVSPGPETAVSCIRFGRTGESMLSLFFKHYQGVEMELSNNGKSMKGSFLGFSGDDTLVLGVGNKVMFLPVEGTTMTVPKDIGFRNSIDVSVDSAKAGKETFEINYIAEGFISWKPAYQVIVEGESAVFMGEAVITNRSGVQIDDATMTCVAGEVEEEREDGLSSEYQTFKLTRMMAADSAREMVKAENVLETHRYLLPGRMSIGAGETVKAFLGKQKLDAETSYFYEGRGFGREGGVSTRVKFTNNSGQLVHGGVMTVYLKDKGARHFIGEKRLKPIPEGESGEIELGSAFDVTVTRSVAKRGMMQRNATVIIVENKKSVPIMMTVKENLLTKNRNFGPSPTEKKEGCVIWENVEIPAKSKTEFWYA